MEYYDQISQSAAFLREIIPQGIQDAVILGTGLGKFENNINKILEIPYETIPNFPSSTVKSHSGKLIIGKLDSKTLLVFSGRFHYYEGYSMKSLTLPIRVLALLGIKNLFITNVAGGVKESFNAGDLVMIKDHINLLPENPLRGINDDRLGIRFPDMKDTYTPSLRLKAQNIAEEMGLNLKSGVYLALQGPNLETAAEYQFIHHIGADLVGMSTVPEVIVARHSGMNIFAVSIVSNVCYPPERITETTLESVLEVAENSGNKLSQLLSKLIIN